MPFNVILNSYVSPQPSLLHPELAFLSQVLFSKTFITSATFLWALLDYSLKIKCSPQQRQCSPLLLKESRRQSITISLGFPTALLLTILLLGQFVQPEACPTGKLVPQAASCRVWLAGCSARIHTYEFLQGRYWFTGRAQSLPSGFGEHWAKYCNSGKTAPKRLKAAGGYRRWWPCSCRGDAGHIGCQPRQTWQLYQCLPGVSPGWQGFKAWQNFLPVASGRKSWLQKISTCKESSHASQSTATQSRLWRPAKPISAAWLLCLSKSSSAGTSLRGLLVTSGYHSKTTLFPEFAIAILQWCVSLFPVQNIDFVDSQHISSIYLLNTIVIL